MVISRTPLNLARPPRLRLRLLLPSIALIAIGTMVPTGLRHPSLAYINNLFIAADAISSFMCFSALP